MDPDLVPGWSGCDVESVLKDVDFEKIHRVMFREQWYWATAVGGGVPSKDEVRAMARSLLQEAVYALQSQGVDSVEVRTGGLVARASRADLAVWFSLSTSRREWEEPPDPPRRA